MSVEHTYPDLSLTNADTIFYCRAVQLSGVIASGAPRATMWTRRPAQRDESSRSRRPDTLGASKPPHFHKTPESHVSIAWSPNLRLHLPSLMADGCIILKNLSRDLVRGGQLVISALHPLETLNFFVVGVVKISAVSRILLCACRYYNNFLSPTFLFMRKQLYMWLRMVLSRYENHWNTFQ